MGFAIPLKKWMLSELQIQIENDLGNKSKFVFQQFGNIGSEFFDELKKEISPT